MLKYQKKIIDNSIDLMEQAHSAIHIQIAENQTSETPELLQMCQECMIRIGEIIEKSEGEDCPCIHDMETYCEYVFMISLSIDHEEDCRELQLKLRDIFEKIINQIQNIVLKKEIVFFPYNASMWDSLESIWIAADKDPDVEAFVIPIPYYEKNSQGEVVVEKYDGKKFPPYVPIINYRIYNLAEHQPDIAYIHNPFDKFNIVTSVHLDYYSNELKKNISKVVYVPYFFTEGPVYYTHRDLPSYYHVDNIVVQCEMMIDSFAPTIKREKFLPIGNPIADRIINLDKNKPDIPIDWKPMLPNGIDFGGKKVVMFNTSLTMMMKERENFLEKIEYVIHIFREINDVIMVWRPHPLMHVSLQTIGNEFYQKFLNIERTFLEERIGVLDKTADVGIAVALCDAYVGEAASSVIHMFGVAGKPRFFTDLQTYGKSAPSEEGKVTSFGSYNEDDIEYFVAEEYRYICKRNKLVGEVEILAQIPGTKMYPYGAYKDIYKHGDNIYLQPYSGQGIGIYNMREDSFRKIYVKDSISYGFAGMIWDKNAIYLLPNEYPYIVKMDMDTEELHYYRPEDEEVQTIAHLIKNTVDKLEKITYQLTQQAVHQIKAKELVQRTGGSVAWEKEENRIQDFLYYLTTEGLHNKKQIQQDYKNINANLDGTCGEKIHEMMKNSLG